VKSQLTCAVCGHFVHAQTPAYVLSISPQTQWLRVQQWEEKLAGSAGVRTVCQSAHALEIVALWMATGSLQFDFAQPTVVRAPSQNTRGRFSSGFPGPRTAARAPINAVAEGSLDYSMARQALEADPAPLVRSLDTLLAALRRSEQLGSTHVQANALSIGASLSNRLPRLSPSAAPLSAATRHLVS